MQGQAYIVQVGGLESLTVPRALTCWVKAVSKCATCDLCALQRSNARRSCLIADYQMQICDKLEPSTLMHGSLIIAMGRVLAADSVVALG